MALPFITFVPRMVLHQRQCIAPISRESMICIYIVYHQNAKNIWLHWNETSFVYRYRYNMIHIDIIAIDTAIRKQTRSLNICTNVFGIGCNQHSSRAESRTRIMFEIRSLWQSQIVLSIQYEPNECISKLCYIFMIAAIRRAFQRPALLCAFCMD